MRNIPSLDWLSDDIIGSDAVEARCLELIDRELQNAWAALLQSEQGRLIAWSILDHCHVFSSSFTGNANQAFLEGERSIGLKILKGHVLPNGNHLIGDMMDEASARHGRLMLVAEHQINGEQTDE